MSDIQLPVYSGIAEAFRVEGVTTYFVLLGDGNMHWSAAMSVFESTRAIHVRHEHCAVAMAMGYAIATGNVGVASVTCGPGLTQITTALAGAAQSHTPLVVFAGEVPIKSAWYNQTMDQAALVRSTGAHYIAIHSVSRVFQQIREAFHIARFEQRPVVLAMPFDLQRETLPQALHPLPAAHITPELLPSPPNPKSVDFLLHKLSNAACPVFIAGRGAMAAGAKDAIEKLADEFGALLATTLPARGLFDDHIYSLGIAGGYSTEVACEVFSKCDLIIAFGASLTHYTANGGHLYPNAYVIQVDTKPKGIHNGRPVANHYILADAKLTAEAVSAASAGRITVTSYARTRELSQRIAQCPAHSTNFDIPAGTIDPRAVIAELDRVIPKDWDIVSGGGHCAYFNTQMRGRDPRNYHNIREFGAVGNGLSFAIGVAAARPHGKTVLFEGDGGIMMNVQELDTLARYNLRILVCCLNDGGFGAEFHRLVAEGIDDSGSRYGRTEIARISEGFGLRGLTVESLDVIEQAFASFDAQSRAEVWNIQIADTVPSPDFVKIINSSSKYHI